jgi:hypothetical protein
MLVEGDVLYLISIIILLNILNNLYYGASHHYQVVLYSTGYYTSYNIHMYYASLGPKLLEEEKTLVLHANLLYKPNLINLEASTIILFISLSFEIHSHEKSPTNQEQAGIYCQTELKEK